MTIAVSTSTSSPPRDCSTRRIKKFERSRSRSISGSSCHSRSRSENSEVEIGGFEKGGERGRGRESEEGDFHRRRQLNKGKRRDSKVSSTGSTRSKREYLDSLEMPDKETIRRIGEVQVKKEKEGEVKRKRESLILGKRTSLDVGAGVGGGIEGLENGVGGLGLEDLNEEERQKAAELIQRNYRGFRERRMLEGMSLDPGTRWVEAVKEARYRFYTRPKGRDEALGLGIEGEGGRESLDSVGTERTGGTSTTGNRTRSSTIARENWKKIAMITRRAGGDEESDSGDEGGAGVDGEIGEKEKEEIRKRKTEQKLQRQKAAKVMDLQYFLEMVDLKHRYGSNLRTYHEQWKKSDTKENFFYWLDFGEGRFVDCAACPRERLEREMVRYLSKEERLDYLVRIDGDGRLCWVKNGERIDTREGFRDSIRGIVREGDEAPVFRAPGGEAAMEESSESEDEDGEHHESASELARANKYANPEMDKAKGVKKVKQVSAATIFNKLLRGSVKKNTWIFVADTSFRLYVGIKQSGAFQHSSFLHGSRISAAGLIKVKDGRLSKLSPLSGHYRPPVSNFRAFVHSLKEAGADMSHVSISRSYAVLVGLETYVKARKRGKKILKKMVHGKDKILDPVETKKKEEEARDKTESAAKELRFIEARREEAEMERERQKERVLGKLGIRSHEAREGEERKSEVEIQAPGTGPENDIAPDGRREE